MSLKCPQARLGFFFGYYQNLSKHFPFLAAGPYKGLPQDFETLRNAGVDATGKIVLIRYGEAFRGLKARTRESLLPRSLHWWWHYSHFPLPRSRRKKR